MTRILQLGPLLVLLFAVAAHGQTSASLSPEARRDELAKVQEMLADPDPLMRLTNMEAIIKSGDALKLQVAMRIALTSDDKELRALALRAYLATRKQITFDVAVPADVTSAHDAARDDPKAMRTFNQRFPFYEFLAQFADRFQLEFPDYDVSQVRGIAHADRQTGEFTMTGDRLSTMLVLHNWRECYVDFGPTKRQTFEGTLACGRWPKLPISAPAL